MQSIIVGKDVKEGGPDRLLGCVSYESGLPFGLPGNDSASKEAAPWAFYAFSPEPTDCPMDKVAGNCRFVGDFIAMCEYQGPADGLMPVEVIFLWREGEAWKYLLPNFQNVGISYTGVVGHGQAALDALRNAMLIPAKKRETALTVSP